MLVVMKLLDLARESVVWGASAVVIAACGPDAPAVPDGTGTTGTGMDATTSTGTTDAGDATAVADTTADTTAGPDMGGPDDPSECHIDDGCARFDVLFVIDNSGSMVEEQLSVARNFPRVLDELMALTEPDGDPVEPDVHIMVTTTDMGHPLCTPFEKPDYAPRQGAPVYEGCNARIERFTGLDPMDPVVIEEACTEGCPVDVVPEDHFIRFGPEGSNVPGDDVHAALSCIGPQGFDGCGYQAPLEAMLRAIDPQACWNDPTQPECDDQDEWADATEGFLREDATLVIVLVGDGLDCSVAEPDGYAYFTDPENAVYWSTDPALGVPMATPAICFNAGVSCVDDFDGTYVGCSSDGDVLHPVERYRAALREIGEVQGKHVVMLGALGVPPVVAHNPRPPFQPIAGGLVDLVYREWVDAPYPAGDVLPDAWAAGRRAADEAFVHGELAPGCIGMDGRGAFIGHALPPVREREVCESLNVVDEETGETRVRCCVESICDEDFSAAVRCLFGPLGPLGPDVVGG